MPTTKNSAAEQTFQRDPHRAPRRGLWRMSIARYRVAARY